MFAIFLCQEFISVPQSLEEGLSWLTNHNEAFQLFCASLKTYLFSTTSVSTKTEGICSKNISSFLLLRTLSYLILFGGGSTLIFSCYYICVDCSVAEYILERSELAELLTIDEFQSVLAWTELGVCTVFNKGLLS